MLLPELSLDYWFPYELPNDYKLDKGIAFYIEYFGIHFSNPTDIMVFQGQ